MLPPVGAQYFRSKRSIVVLVPNIANLPAEIIRGIERLLTTRLRGSAR